MTTVMANRFDTTQVLDQPPSGHNINDKDNNSLMVANLTSVVKQGSKEAINSNKGHYNFSGGVSTDEMGLTTENNEQESAKDVTNLGSTYSPPSSIKKEQVITGKNQISNLGSKENKEDKIIKEISPSSTRKHSEDDKENKIIREIPLSSTRKPSEDVKENKIIKKISPSSTRKTSENDKK